MNSIITDMYAQKPRTAGIGTMGKVETAASPVEPPSSGVSSNTGIVNAEENTSALLSTPSGMSYSIDRTGSWLSHIVEDTNRQPSNTEASDAATVFDVVMVTGAQRDDVIVIEDSRSGCDESFSASTTTLVPSLATGINRQHAAEEKPTVFHVAISSW